MFRWLPPLFPNPPAFIHFMHGGNGGRYYGGRYMCVLPYFESYYHRRPSKTEIVRCCTVALHTSPCFSWPRSFSCEFCYRPLSYHISPFTIMFLTCVVYCKYSTHEHISIKYLPQPGTCRPPARLCKNLLRLHSSRARTYETSCFSTHRA